MNDMQKASVIIKAMNINVRHAQDNLLRAKGQHAATVAKMEMWEQFNKNDFDVNPYINYEETDKKTLQMAYQEYSNSVEVQEYTNYYFLKLATGEK